MNIFPFCKSPAVSKAKVEKVVKPPQIPTLSIRISCGGMDLFLAARAVIRLIKKAPKILIKNVFTGKPLSVFKGINPMR